MTTRRDFGKHYLVDFLGCDPETIKFVGATKEIFVRAAKESKAVVVGEAFHQFDPFGVSGVLLIAESHFSIHTWPEDGFVGVDVFTCGEEMDPDIAISVLNEGLRAETVNVKVLVRGQLHTPDAVAGADA